MKLLTLIIVAIFALGAAPTATPIGEKEFETAIKEYLRAVSGESAAVKAARQKAVIDGLMGEQVNFKGKLGREDPKDGKVEVDVVDDSAIRTIVVTKTRDTVTGGKIGKDITIGGEVAKVVITPAGRRAIKGKTTDCPPRIDITVK